MTRLIIFVAAVVTLASFARYVMKVSDCRAKLRDYHLRRADRASRRPSADRATMALTPPSVVVLDDPGKSKHLRIKGVLGGASISVTDADLRTANDEDRRSFAALSRQRFVVVDVAGLGRLDKIHTVSFEVPVVTTLAPPPSRRPTAPPKARRTGSK